MGTVSSPKGSVESILRGSYLSYKSEGMRFFHTGDFKRAISWFANAIELNSDDFESYLWRSRCHVMLGDLANSLRDIESATTLEPNHPMCIYMKAETLYQMGELEQALQFFHRGNRQCPTVLQFNTGINKARDAIDRCVGDPATVKLSLIGDLSHFKKLNERNTRPAKPATRRHNNVAKAEPIKPVANEKTLVKLLQELYGDKAFFDKLKAESVKEMKYTQETKDLIDEGLLLLHRRSDFFQQHNPVYARKYEKKMKHRMTCTEVSTDAMQEFLDGELEKITKARAEGNRDASLRRAHRCLTLLKYTYKGDVPKRKSFIADLHCLVGAVQLDSEHLTRALHHFDIANDMAEKHEFNECHERVLELQGKTYFKQANYSQALSAWHKKLTMCDSHLEKAIVCQEIGITHMIVGNIDDAEMYGIEAVFFAELSGNTTAILGSLLLVGRANMRLGEFLTAKDKLIRAVRMARKKKDADMEAAIMEVLAELREEIDFPEGRTPDMSEYLIGRSLDTLSLRSLERCQANKYNTTCHAQQKQRQRKLSSKSRPRDYRGAICLWLEKLAIAKTPVECAILCIDIGRARLELVEYKESLEYGNKALAFAEEANDELWILQALMVQGYAATRMKDFALASKAFNRALDWCLKEKNTHAEALVRDGLAAVGEVCKDADVPVSVEDKDVAKNPEAGVDDSQMERLGSWSYRSCFSRATFLHTERQQRRGRELIRNIVRRTFARCSFGARLEEQAPNIGPDQHR
ncbi:Tetratricopeptide repeat protein 25 [Lamellibrachia satsuma]|nr:Tetratricopeptide repeat protein 25 [Lamellibrachia satsuma]